MKGSGGYQYSEYISPEDPQFPTGVFDPGEKVGGL